MSESVCSLKFAQRVRSVELSSSSSTSRRHENSSTSSSPTHDSVEVRPAKIKAQFPNNQTKIKVCFTE